MQVRDNEVIESLIKEIMSSAKVTRLVFCGSSKGGSSALYYGLKMKADAVICGSPQYNILQYLIVAQLSRQKSKIFIMN